MNHHQPRWRGEQTSLTGQSCVGNVQAIRMGNREGRGVVRSGSKAGRMLVPDGQAWNWLSLHGC